MSYLASRGSPTEEKDFSAFVLVPAIVVGPLAKLKQGAKD